MLTGHITIDGKTRDIDLISVFEAVGKVAGKRMTEAELTEMEELACPAAAAVPVCLPPIR